MWTMSRQLADAVEAEQATAASLALTYATRAPNDEVMDAERVWLHAHQTRHALESQLATGSLGLTCDRVADRLLATARSNRP
ncbi:hypothetical protein [Frankia sp. Cr2]|uniref:hypothetical protein n=1 Tax=Frankia sp. Cr2 TaxID=3073932 RepID=UPI002AD23E85|nr:hypothetical protein [Frankia sp. Cr2]